VFAPHTASRFVRRLNYQILWNCYQYLRFDSSSTQQIACHSVLAKCSENKRFFGLYNQPSEMLWFINLAISENSFSISMPRVTHILRDAQTLAYFSNLEPGEVEYFRNNYPDFAPSAWWDKKIGVDNEALEKQLREQDEREAERNSLADKQALQYLSKWLVASNPVQIGLWQVTQEHLRNWWRAPSKEDIPTLVTMLDSIFDPDLRSSTKNFAEIMVRRYLSEYATIRIPRRPPIKRQGYIPMQAAIVYLFGDPWRARFCRVCHKRFVAIERRNEFCSSKCSVDYEHWRKRENWHKHKDKYRPPNPVKKQKSKKRKRT
jgi:hypothetical protein